MPPTPFISYSKDRHRVVEVAIALRRHGLPAWRDADSLRFGAATREVIEGELDHCQGALLWLSEDTLASDYVTRIELPAIQRQVERRGFRVFPVFVGMTPSAGIDAVVRAAGIEIGNHNGHVLNADATLASETAVIARKYAGVALRDAASAGQRPAVVRCVTRDDTALRRDEADLNFDWRSEYGATLANDSTVARLTDALGAATAEMSASFDRPEVEMELKCHLHIAVALGHAFRKPTGRVPTVRVGEEWWPCADVDVRLATEPLQRHVSIGDASSRAAAVLISLTHDVTAGVNVTVSASRRRYARRTTLVAPAGTGQFAVPDAVTANVWAHQVADEMQHLRADGISDLDVYMAGPVQFAVMLGWRLNAIATVRLFHWQGNHGPYAAAWTLPPV